MGAITSVITRIKDIICCTIADVNSQNSDGNTALHLAVSKSKDVTHVKTLIDAGTNVNTQNSDGNTALHLCCLNTNRFSPARLDSLVNESASDRDVQPLENQTAPVKQVPVNEVPVNGVPVNGVTVNEVTVNEVTFNEVPVNGVPVNGVTVNEVTVNEVTVNEVTFNEVPVNGVPVNGVPVNEVTVNGVTVNEVPVNGVTVNEVSVNEYHLEDYEIAETLINEGADLNIQNNDGNTPLHLALIHSKPSILVHELCDSLNKESSNCVKMCRLVLLQSNVFKLVKKISDKGADVGKQNNEGNTALHLALSSTLQFFDVYERDEKDVKSNVHHLEIKDEIMSIPYHKIAKENFEKLLKILLITRETIYIRNTLDMDPIQMTIDFIKRKCGRYQKESSQLTLVPLLNLEYQGHLTYTDCHGNTLLHLLFEINRYDAFIIKSVDPTYLKFNVQNKVGNTPLHTVPVKAIAYILSNCSKVDLFARNKRNETFLHTIFKFQYLYEKDLKQFLQGQCSYCSKEFVKKLLHCRDIAGNTPLQVFLTNGKTIFSSDFIKLFYEAGADLNACNTNKDSILHCLVKKGSEESIEFAELNVQNVFGESPMFEAREREVVRFLIDSGADLKICNKTGQNLLLSKIYNIDLFFDGILNNIKYLIQNFCLRVKDIHGNNILHYVAWHGMYRDGKESCDVADILLDAGAEIEPDALGQLPCYIAHQMGHVKLARRLCKCENTKHLDEFTFTDNTNIKLSENNFSPYQPCENKIKYFANHFITEILEIPFIGSVKFEDEDEEIRSCIVNIINEICNRLGHENDLLKNKVTQSGSAGENTKVGLPNEFDYMCVFDILSEACYVETVSKQDPAFATVKLKNEIKGHWCRSLYDENCFFSCGTVFHIFMTALRDVVQCLDIYSHPNIMYKKIIHRIGNPNVELYFIWTGRKYKSMEIKVDLVPALQIKGWWPPGTRLNSLACNTEQIKQLREEGAVLLLKTNHYEHSMMLQISVFTAEKNHLAALPLEARNAYKVAKILCDKRVCTRFLFSKSTSVTSYMLKNCMFHVLDNPIESVYDCVCKIFRYLIDCTKTENLPSYVYPHCNVFASNFDIKEEMRYRRISSQIILNMIGSTEEFLPTDIDEMTAILI